MSFVYVCYERNYGGCALDAGPVNEVEVLGTPELAVEWVGQRVCEANKNGFISEEATDISDSGVLEKIKTGYFSVEMYFGYQENYDREYDIVVERKGIKVPEEQFETDNYTSFAKALASSVAVEAIVSFVNGEKEGLLLTEMEEVIRKIRTEALCPKCGCELYMADLAQYDYTCPYCDENFFEIEV